MTNYRRNRVPGGTFFFTVAILPNGTSICWCDTLRI
jgi:hypothetical protein